jgi:Ca2+-binding RTX toxin-like protein
MNIRWTPRILMLALISAASLPAAATLTTSFNGANGTLTVASDAGDAIALACAGGNVTLNAAAIAGPVACNAVVTLNANGGPGVNAITLSAMTSTDFPLLTAAAINGGDSDDTIVGSFLADVIHGDGGGDRIDGFDNPVGSVDQVFGDDGDDIMTWNPGKDDDLNEGGPGQDTSVIIGGAAAETFTIAADAVNAGRVDFARTNPAPFFVDIGTTERLILNANAGDDIITGGAGLNALIALELNGGDNNDTIVGGDGADIIHGGNGNDSIDGNDNPVGSVDQVFGDDGDDTMTWNPGKDDDLNEGGLGFDTSVIVGGGAAETFTIAADAVNAGRVDFARTNPAPFFVDIGTTERLIVNGNAGDDSITGAAGLNTLIALELNGGDNNDSIVGGDGADIIHGGNGNDSIDGNDNPVGSVDQVFGDDGDDTMTWNPGKDDDLNEGGPGFDTSVIVGGGAAETFTIAADAVNAGRVDFARTNPAPFFVDIGTTERLIVNGNAGADIITGGAGLNGLIALELNGGDGNDNITGGDGVDLIHGGNDADTLDGNDNPAATLDQVFGDDGDDTLIWNPGKDDDMNEGGAGFDTVIINAVAAAEQFSIVQVGARVRFDRTNNAPAPFFVDIGTSERLQLNAEGGADRVTTMPLLGTEQVLDGAAPVAVPGDELIVVGFTGNLSQSPIAIPGFGPITHSGFDFAPPTAPGKGFTAALEGSQEEPPVDTTGVGRGAVVLNAAENQITVRLEFSLLGGNNTAAHIHGPALPGVNAAVLFDLGNSGTSSGILGPLVFPVNAQQVADLKAGLWYFNVHSTANPLGEIRGQILGDRVIEAFLTGSQQVPVVGTTATGFGTVTLAGPEDAIIVTLNYIGLAGNNTLTRIDGPAPRGQNGVAIIALETSDARSDTFTTLSIPVTAEQVAQLKRGDWYFNVQSSAHANGELRGQIDNAQFRDSFE